VSLQIWWNNGERSNLDVGGFVAAGGLVERTAAVVATAVLVALV
jgi:hypothetical protein